MYWGADAGADLSEWADLSFWDWVAVATLSFKSALATDFSSLRAERCRP